MLEKIISINVTVFLIVPIATTTVLKWRGRAGVVAVSVFHRIGFWICWVGT